MIKRTIIGICIFLIAATAYAWKCEYGTITFKNNDKYKSYYNFYWVDHPYRDKWFSPMERAGGEVKAGESYIINIELCPGIYLIEWSNIDYIKDGGKIFKFDGSNKELIFEFNGYDK